MTDFTDNLGGRPYYNINTTYYDFQDNEKDPIRNRVNHMGSTEDHYSHGKSISQIDVGNIIQDVVVSGKLPADPNGVYFVLASVDVNETDGFCTVFCAFHGAILRAVSET